MNNKKDSHWWEFYGVRYAQGTVVGALIIFFLFSQSPALKGILFIPSEAKDFGTPHLILLAIYGLAYCYIASAPILIMHAARGLLFISATNPDPNRWRKTRIAIMVISSIIISACFYISSEKNKVLSFGAIFIYSMLVIFQAILLLEVFKLFWKETHDYYLAIIKKRTEERYSEYVESYKHIREHGNSFLIVAFQFFLAAPIFIFVSSPNIPSEEAVRNLVLIVIIWILPASTIWFFGNKLENKLQEM
jgi:membrane protein YdbS with pleckstrin-like domain